MRVLVTNAVLSNGGDAAILLGLLEALRRGSPTPLDVTVLEDDPEAVRGLYPELDLGPTLAGLWSASLPRGGGRIRARVNGLRLRHRERRADGALREGRAERLVGDERQWLAAYAGADAVVSTGGTYLTDNYRLVPRLLELKAARSVRKPLVLYTQSIGPLGSASAQRAVGEELRAAKLVLLRDEASKELVDRLGVKETRRRVAADAAFGLPVRAAAGRSEWGAVETRRPRVAISVRHWRHYRHVDPVVGQERYREAVAGLVDRLVSDRDMDVLFLSTCQGIPSYATDDSAEAVRIAQSLPAAVAKRVTVDRQPHRPEELVERYADCDAVVATRMHAGILAMLGGTPVVPVAYEFKTTELYARLGVPGWVVDIETIDAAQLVAGVGRILAGPQAARQRVARIVETERAAALAVGREAIEAILDPEAEGVHR